MSEALRLAAWLDANSKHMEYEDEAVHMRKAAKELRTLDREIKSNLEALQKAKDALSGSREFSAELFAILANELSKQAPSGSGEGLSVPSVRG